MKKVNKEIIVNGYVNIEEGLYTAISVNMSIFGQGKTVEEALEKVKKALKSYVTFVLEEYPDKCEELLNRPVPATLMKEYKRKSLNTKIETIFKINITVNDKEVTLKCLFLY